MIELKDSILIAYPPGAYGHYLCWVLNNFTEIGTHYNSEFPVDDVGSSHTPSGKNSGKMIKLPDKIRALEQVPYIFNHTHIYAEMDNYKELIEIVSNEIKNVIIINHNSDNLQILNNFFEKGYKQNITSYIKIMTNCNDFVSKNTWADREYLSYKTQFDKGSYIKSTHLKNSIEFNMSTFLYNFENFIKTIADFLDTKIIKYDKLLIHHENMLAKQKHLNKDRNIGHFLKCFKERIDCRLPECSIIDEAAIQQYLRDELNLEIMCEGLEIFPRSTAELRKISYPAEELIRIE